MRFKIMSVKWFPKILALMALMFFSYYPNTSLFAWTNIKQKPDRGDAAPDFTLSDIHGKPHRLSDYQGKVVLLNFWAKWCGPCMAEMPSLESLKKKLKDEDFVILTISIHKESLLSLKKFVEEKRYTFTVLHCPDGSIQKLYRAGAVPTSFVIDKKGIVFSRIIGGQEWDCADAIQHLKGALMKYDK